MCKHHGRKTDHRNDLIAKTTLSPKWFTGNKTQRLNEWFDPKIKKTSKTQPPPRQVITKKSQEIKRGRGLSRCRCALGRKISTPEINQSRMPFLIQKLPRGETEKHSQTNPKLTKRSVQNTTQIPVNNFRTGIQFHSSSLF